MSILDDIKAKADTNGEHDEIIEQLKSKADLNDDGKLDLSDLKDIKGDVGGLLGGLKDKLFK